jgi:hypothetical protein
MAADDAIRERIKTLTGGLVEDDEAVYRHMSRAELYAVVEVQKGQAAPRAMALAEIERRRECERNELITTELQNAREAIDAAVRAARASEKTAHATIAVAIITLLVGMTSVGVLWLHTP